VRQGLENSIPDARLAAGSEGLGSGDVITPATPRPADPFGLQTAPRVAPTTNAAKSKAAPQRRPGSGQPTMATSESSDEPAANVYGIPPPLENAAQPFADQPAPLQRSTDGLSNEELQPTQPSSVFDAQQGGDRRLRASVSPPQEEPLPQKNGGTRVQTLNNQYVPADPARSAATGKNVAPTASNGGAYSGDSVRPLGRRAELQESAMRPDSASGATGEGRPGSRQLDGEQVPQLTLEKVAPAEVQVGKSANFELHVRNTGAVAAQNVRVHDVVPAGTEFVAANPPATPGAGGDLVWSLGTLKPGDEATIEVEVTPIVEGEVGSVAVVSFSAEAGARSRVTRPDLTLQVTTAKEVMIGHDVTLSIKLANPGSGPATGVVLEERVPPGLKHAAGPELEFEVGTLKPGETRELELTLTAAQAGRIVNQIAARGDANLQAQALCELEVIAPALEIEMEGPARRYLERQATYTVSVSNPGTATAKDVELVTRLPRGLKFVKANNSGHYDPGTHTVVWSLEELPPAESGTVMLTALPVEPGEQRLRAEGRAKQNLTDEQEQITLVEGLAELSFQIRDVADPIEVNGETHYEITISNQGSKAAENVRLVALLPRELKFVSADGPARYAASGQQVVFEPIARLMPGAETSCRIAVQGLQSGDLRMRVQVTADDLQQPIIKEESTRVYADE
jgi:uncharacterized repeat protein (TIGR01451 family)